MSLRNRLAFSALLLFGCATQQTTAPSETPAPAPAQPQTQTQAQAQAPAEPAKPAPLTKEEERKRIEALRAELESLRVALREAAAAVAAADAKTATNELFDRAREAKTKLEKLLADNAALETKDEEYGREAAVVKLELEKTKPELEARWVQFGAALQKLALDAAQKDVGAAQKSIAKKDATADDLTKAETTLAAMSAVLERGAAIEAKDPKYAQLATQKKQQLEAAKKSLEDNKKRIAVQAQQDRVTKAKTAADAAVAKLKTTTEEPAFEAAQAGLTALEEALNAGKELEATNPAYQKLANTVRAASEKSKTEIAAARTRQKIAAHKTTVEAARAAVKDALAKTDPAGLEAAEKAIAELEKALEGGKDFVATDKAYAQYASGLAKEITTNKATLEKLKQQGAVAADRTRVKAAGAEADAKLQAAQEKPEPAELAAAEQALTALEAAIKAAEPLAAKDKPYAGELAALTKKLAQQKTALAKKNGEQKITAHKAEVAAQRAKVDASLEALKGKLEQELYIKAEDEVAAMAKLLDAAEPFSAADPKYAQELKTLKAALPGQRLLMRTRRVEAAREQLSQRMKALEGTPDEAAFKAAKDAVRVFANTVESAKSFSTTDKAYLAGIAAAEKQVPSMEQAVEKRRLGVELAKQHAAVDAAAEALAEKLKALEGEPAAPAFGAAEAAALELESAITSGVAAEDDKAHQAYLTANHKKVDAARAQIAKRKTEAATAAEKKKVDAATAAVKEKLKALEGEPAEAAFGAAEESVSALEEAIKNAGSAADNDPKFAKELAAAKNGVTAFRAQIEKRKNDVAVAALRAKIDEASSAVAQHLGKPEGIGEAEQAISALEAALQEGEGLGAKDAKLAALLAAVKKKLPAQQAQVARMKTEGKIAAHKSDVDAKKKKLEEAFAACKGKMDQPLYAAAEESIAALEGALEAGDPIGEEDKKYGATLKAEKGALAGKRAQLRRLRIEAATAAVKDALDGLDGESEQAAFEKAEESIELLTKIVEASKKLPNADKNYLTLIAATEKQIPAHQAAIEKHRLAQAIAAHRKAWEAARADLTKRLEAIDGEANDAGLAAADQAITALEKALGGDAETIGKDAKYAKELAAVKAKLPAYHAQIEKQRAAKAVAAHAEELSAAENAAKKALAALEGKTEQPLYVAAEDAVDKLRKTAEAGSALGEKDAAYKKRLAAVQGAIDGYRASMRKTRIEAAAAVVAERMKALSGKVEEPAFAAAEKAIKDLGNTIESARDFKTKEKDYAKSIAAAEKRVEANRAAIEKKRAQLVVDAHRAELEEAQNGVDEAMKALGPKAAPEAFDAADKAVTQLDSTINSGSEAGAKDKEYGKRLAALRKKIDVYRATIEKKRADAEVAGTREKLLAAGAAASEKIAALGAKPEDAAFSAADEAIESFEGAIKESQSFAKKNKAFEKELAAQEKKVAANKARVAAKRLDVERAQAAEELAEAESAAAEKVKALAGKPEAAAFDGAEEAVSALEKAIEAGGKYAKADKKLAGKLAADKKNLPKQRAAIKTARAEGELRAHRDAVETAEGEVEKKIEALKGDVSQPSLRAADGAIKALESALSGGDALAKKNKKHAAWMASYKKRIAEFKVTMGRRAAEDQIKAHRAELEEAEANAKKAVEAVKGQLEYSLYQQAETAVDELRKTIDAGSSLAEKDPAYGKELAAAGTRIDAKRVLIRKRWVEAADAAATEKMKALASKPDEAAFNQATAAVHVLENTIESGKSLEKKDKAYREFALAATKRMKSDKAQIDRRRSETEFSEVRGELEEAQKTAAEKMAALDKDADTAACDAADSALTALEHALDSNAPAADKDKAYGKRLAVLKKRLVADRAKVDHARVSAEQGPQKEKLAAAESALAEKLAALKGPADSAAIDAAESAVSDLESALDDGKPSAGASAKEKAAHKAKAAKLRKKIELAKATIKTKKGGLAFGEHRAEVESAISSARDAVAALEKNPGAAAYDAANDAVKGIGTAIDSGKALAKKNPKHAAYLAGARKTAKQLAAAIKKKKPSASEPSQIAEAEESDDDPAAAKPAKEAPKDPKAAAREAKAARIAAAEALGTKLDSARAGVKEKFAALGKSPSEDAIAAAKSSLDELSTAIDEVKAENSKSKMLAKKMALSKAMLVKGKKDLDRREVALAKAAKVDKGEKAEASEKVDHQGRLKETWAAFARQLKVIKKKKPSVEELDSALEAASEVDAALREGDRAGAMKNPKYKKLAGAIKKKLARERAGLKKMRDAAEYT